MKLFVQLNRRMNIIIIFLFIHSIGAVAQAESSFINKHLMDLMTSLESYNVPADFIGEKHIRELSKEKPIIVQQNKSGAVNHIGFKLFDRTLTEKHPSPLYYFVERYFLELLISKDDNALQTRLKQERVKLSSEKYPRVPLLQGIKQLVDGFSTEHSILINCSNNRYSIVATDGKKEIFTLEFPVRYELITGQSKLEAENSVYPQLMTHRPSTIATVNESDLSVYKDSLYVFNNEYYMAENILASSYYRKSGDTFTPIFDKSMLAESIYNLFNAYHHKDYQLEVTQKMYGNKTNTFTIQLPVMMDYLRSQHCQIYSGIRKIEKDRIEGVVLAVNSELGYQHIGTFTMSPDFLQSSSSTPIKVSMYSFIPIHNISTIFGK